MLKENSQKKSAHTVYPSCYKAIKLTTINLYKASHLANEALNETIVQNPILPDMQIYSLSARDQTADRHKATASNVSVASSQTTQENNKCQSELWNETGVCNKDGGLLNFDVWKSHQQ